MSNTQASPIIHGIFDAATWTVSYVVHSGAGSAAAVIDSVLDYDPKSGRTRTDSADKIVAYVKENKLKLEWIFETHAHADHLTAAPYLKRQLGGKVAIGKQITRVQEVFKGLFNLEPEFRVDGSQFDALLADGDRIEFGGLTAQVMALPGHTPACIAYKINDAVFVGDTIFMPDVGTARADFPGGDAKVLYSSIHKLLSLPEQTRLFMCHDYPPSGRPVAFETTVKAQREQNIHVRDGITEEEFVAMRSKRDAGLEMPVLILPSVQVNIRAGAFPPSESNGTSYLKIPLNVL